ncbi:MAG: hypothetical protein KY476_19590 [Planctomycetes bacterium]|nr:hypothetical protein [Planctomycetota bacterium]
MRDPWNPAPDEIRDWAYDADALAPCEDFDLALAWTRHEKALFECASDGRCPKRDFFLRVLYLIVGDAVRSNYRSIPRPIIEGFIARADDYRHLAIQVWQLRSRDLMKHPDRFEYNAWCAGGLLANDPS